MPLSLAATRSIHGFVRANLINAHYGMGLMSEGVPDGVTDLDMETAAMTQTFAAGRQALHELGHDDDQEDLIITLHDQYHMMRGVDGMPEVFMHLVLNRGAADLAEARQILAEIGQSISADLGR